MRIKGDEVEFSIQDIFEIVKAFISAVKWFGRFPKNEKNKIGIIVALRTENDRERTILQNDFISELSRYLSDSGVGDLFNLIVYPSDLATTIDTQKQATELLIKSRAHFMIHGALIQRKINGKLTHLFKLHGNVRHVPVAKDISADFSREFTAVLPAKIVISEEDELGFEVAKQWVGYVVKHVVGVAAFLSYDVSLAYRLLHELFQELSAHRGVEDVPVISEIAKRTRTRLIEILAVILAAKYNKFCKGRNKSSILEGKIFLDELLQLDPAHYQGRLFGAILNFEAGRVDEAIAMLRDLNIDDATWRYSLGFLLAFKGDVAGALEVYKKITYYKVNPRVIGEVEIFMNEVIREHPQNFPLIFFRGLINYKAKPDYELAKEDFLSFLSSGRESNYPELFMLAKKYLSVIENDYGS